MTLTSHIIDQVPVTVQRQGRKDFERGAVRLQQGDSWFVEATVQGSNEVTLDRENKAVQMWCSCRKFRDYLDPCRHIWATFLAAEAKGYLVGSGTSDHLRLQPVEDGYDDWDEEDAWDDPEPDYWDRYENGANRNGRGALVGSAA